ncbi:uncharacterized protein LOC122186963 [Lagopus leucura]|uniref:uncharacterized protein LOC122186963 n=1 Tax=Lagopus leucura TaxID=30410 RepID=UPI001C67137A|nr:uncharacterized protein LOC122186963 [Lagopus leucura]
MTFMAIVVSKRIESCRRAPAAPHRALHPNPIPKEEMRVEKQSWFATLPESPMVTAQGAREQPKRTWGSAGLPSTHLSIEIFLLFYVLPPCAGSFRRTKTGEQKEASTAQTSTALPATEESKRVLQELREVSALWKEADHTWPVHQQQIEQTQAEMAAWEGWSVGKDQRPPQLLARESVRVPHPPAQPRRQQVGRRWRKDVDPVPGSKMGTATKLALHADLLSHRAAQVLQKLELHLHQQEAFASTVERNRQKLELKRQLPRARCSHRSREEGAANRGDRGGAVGKGAGKPSRFPPVNGRS